MPVPSRMLWVDDRISSYGPWITKFNEFGTAVDSTNTLADGLQKLETNSYDVVLLDLMMEHESCMHMLSIVSEKARSAKLFVCSGFLYLPEVIKQLGQQRQKKIRFGQVDKTNLPFTDDDRATVQFLEDLNTADEAREHVNVELEILSAQERPSSGAKFPSWSEYSDLDARGKIAALRAAALATKDIRKELADAGYRYLLFCGSWTSPILRFHSLEDAPTQDEVVAKARTVGFAPFVFSIGGRVDDCSDRSGLLGYPVLRLTYHGSSEEVHFDSGNPYSLLSYEWFSQKGWLPVSFSFDVHSAGEMDLIGTHFKLLDTIITDASGKSETVTFKGFAVADWNGTRLATRCQPDCPDFANRQQLDRICKFRTGLLGRNLPQSMGKHWKIDFSSGKTFFL